MPLFRFVSALNKNSHALIVISIYLPTHSAHATRPSWLLTGGNKQRNGLRRGTKCEEKVGNREKCFYNGTGKESLNPEIVLREKLESAGGGGEKGSNCLLFSRTGIFRGRGS